MHYKQTHCVCVCHCVLSVNAETPLGEAVTHAPGTEMSGIKRIQSHIYPHQTHMFLTVNTIQTTVTSWIMETTVLLYLHPRLCEPVQLLQIHIVSGGAVKQTGQHDQPHDSSSRFRSWTRTLLGSALLGSALVPDLQLPADVCEVKWSWGQMMCSDVTSGSLATSNISATWERRRRGDAADWLSARFPSACS